MTDEHDGDRRPLDLASLVPFHLRAHVSAVDMALARAREARLAYERAYEEERRLHRQAGRVDLDAAVLTREAAMPLLKWCDAHDRRRRAESDLYDTDMRAFQCLLRFAEVEVVEARAKLDDAGRVVASLRGRGAAAEMLALCDLSETRKELERCLNLGNQVKADQHQLRASERERLAEIDARDAACLAEANHIAASKLEEARRLFETGATGRSKVDLGLPRQTA